MSGDCEIDHQEGEESVQLIEKAGGKGLYIKTDIGFEAEIEALVARTVDHFGRLNFAFNNAAVVYLCSPHAGFTTGIALPLDGGASA
jgi:NAD(P)-dependent dehydrogenase (short-subunit alcohol dehydrogenase family)